MAGNLLVAVLFSWLAATGCAQTFRGTVAAGEGQVDLEAEYVKSGGDQAEVAQLQEWLLPFWSALPKNREGMLEHHSARYVLHRLFVQRHGWYIKGLEPKGDVWKQAATFEDWVPTSLLGALQGKAGSHGLTLKDLAVLGAALKHRSNQETTTFMEGMQDILIRKGMTLELLTSNGTKPMGMVQELVFYYVARFLGGVVYTPEWALVRAQPYLAEYRDWSNTKAWYKAIERERLADASVADISVAVNVATGIGERYGAYNDQGCQKLKMAFLGTWERAKMTGRIRLADFYKLGFDSVWDLDEKVGYLKALGALDDSNASSPMVIIPNYLTSRSNCLEATQLYAVCCRNECEDLLGHLESSIAGPSADPARILELVANLGSDTVFAPRAISDQLQGRLTEVAATHGGEVNIHGRLFAQWMHHVYPNECASPHETAEGFTSPDEWIGQEGASEEERAKIVEDACSADEAAENWSGELPWSEEEVLLSTEAHEQTQGAGQFGKSRCVLFVAVLVVLVQLQASSQRERFLAYAAGMGLLWQHMFLLAFLIVAFVCNLVNRVILVLALCIMLVRMFALGNGKPNKSMELCF